MTIALDASVALSFVLADEHSPRSARLLASIAEDGAVVPTLWDYEVLNGVRSAQARGRLTPAAATLALRGLARLPIDRVSIPADATRLLALSIDSGLSAYDAAYLDLAMHGGHALATFDASLATAATALGISLVD